jgi:hypothetical protein
MHDTSAHVQGQFPRGRRNLFLDDLVHILEENRITLLRHVFMFHIQEWRMKQIARPVAWSIAQSGKSDPISDSVRHRDLLRIAQTAPRGAGY